MAVLINPMNRRIRLILIVSSIHDNRRLIFLCQDKIVCQRHPLLRRRVALYQKNYQSQHNDGSDSPNYPTQSAIPRLSARSLSFHLSSSDCSCSPENTRFTRFRELSFACPV